MLSKLMRKVINVPNHLWTEQATIMTRQQDVSNGAIVASNSSYEGRQSLSDLT